MVVHPEVAGEHPEVVVVRREVLRKAEDAEEAVAVNKILTKFETLHMTCLFGRFLMEYVR